MTERVKEIRARLSEVEERWMQVPKRSHEWSLCLEQKQNLERILKAHK